MNADRGEPVVAPPAHVHANATPPPPPSPLLCLRRGGLAARQFHNDMWRVPCPLHVQHPPPPLPHVRHGRVRAVQPQEVGAVAPGPAGRPGLLPVPDPAAAAAARQVRRRHLPRGGSALWEWARGKGVGQWDNWTRAMGPLGLGFG